MLGKCEPESYDDYDRKCKIHAENFLETVPWNIKEGFKGIAFKVPLKETSFEGERETD